MNSREEIEKHFLAFEAVHEQCFQGKEDWGKLAEFFTETIDYTDPGWGRMHGKERVTGFLRDSMAGLEDWDFPMRWYAIDGEYAVKKYSMVLQHPVREDGTRYEISGVYMMRYAGEGKFSWVEDQLNMTHFMLAIKDSGWQPGPGFTIPQGVVWD